MRLIKPSDVSGLKDLGVFIGWLMGIFLLGGLLWYGTQHARANVMIRSVNTVLDALDDPRRLKDPLSFRSIQEQGGRFSLVGTNGRAVVFSIITEGTFVPFVAMISPEGKVEELVPLTDNPGYVWERLTPGTITIHTRRIEAEEALIASRGEEK
jgi:hypothetical protein